MNDNILNLQTIKLAKGVITLPGSKSISNRILLLAALSNNETNINDILFSEDTEIMMNALKTLGVKIVLNNDRSIKVIGNDFNFPVKESNLFLGNAGTAFRPLTAVLSIMGGSYILSGIDRMHERPIKDLVDALCQIGANIKYLKNEGYPPIKIKNPNFTNNHINIKGNVSSQFLTSILLSGPIFNYKTQKNLSIYIDGDLISKPYIDITLNLMKRFGVDIQHNNFKRFEILANSKYTSPGNIYIEGDASSASYLLSMGAIGLGPVRVYGVGKNSIQGDIEFTKILNIMGASISFGDNWIESRGIKVHSGEKLKAFNYDFNLIPDAAMTAAVLAIFADGPCKLNNIGSWRVKETDRIYAMQNELQKIGAKVISGNDWMIIYPINDNEWKDATIDTWNDHRIAMALSLAAFGKSKITISNPKCVNKTFPNYFDVYKNLIIN
ncbi:3-phosphoshikimate 1-carboxyvinyltransferase [Candidatus Kinetoplastibacterium sorsogonicusi]|uniref:3-phosphoshikimate 1-carboxyvinyltransferase n=1 Tax=Candidatus Kinetoplastidibacterium kentomonadis TaxID=1576550 RepID=A0A3Q8EX19_9PROT|nr:3-phosphoshikimate 1-carboxyvinyltransferase [Candidatus Kinetoplastibacterium sorsogonicusi]AWD32527.1 3-phosphoshikimate 1-carboxyvinyltransferase [Candidatus Kinetoplastibacterium sorsogonicusi]